LKYGIQVRTEAIRYFEMGFADKRVARLLGISCGTVKEWLYTYRAHGKEALFVTKHQSYSYDLKLSAVKAVTEGKMTKSRAMEIYGIKSLSSLNVWCRLYIKEGPDALRPKPKGRPKKTTPVFSSREEELEARVRELELENEILKRLDALAEETKQKRQTR